MPIDTASPHESVPPVRMRRPRPVLPSMWALPHPSEADEDGVVGIGADLEPGTLADAYLRGMFPWPHPDMPLPWFSPDPRAIIPVDDLIVSRSLKSLIRRSSWRTTINTAFSRVMQACAIRDDEPTWITQGMITAYTRLHDLSWAHSIEVWEDNTLIGGVYGVQLGAIFTAESMFFRRSNASKVALVALCHRFREAGGVLIDAQVLTPHLASLGALNLPRSAFLRQLETLRDVDVRMRIDEQPVAHLV